MNGALDGLDGRRVERVLLGQGQGRVERLVGAGAGREALDADARVDDLVGRAEAGRRASACCSGSARRRR